MITEPRTTRQQRRAHERRWLKQRRSEMKRQFAEYRKNMLKAKRTWQ